MSSKSVYLLEYRLSDIMAAIQVLGASNWQSLKQEHWLEQLGRPQSSSTKSWNEVFQQHPEFFWLEDREQRATLRWRFALEKSFDAYAGKLYTAEQKEQLTDSAIRERLTRRPLSADEIGMLMNTAMELHTRALSLQQESRWWVPIVSSFIGGILGAVLGVVLKH